MKLMVGQREKPLFNKNQRSPNKKENMITKIDKIEEIENKGMDNSNNNKEGLALVVNSVNLKLFQNSSKKTLA
jgi:hypothetical protein